MTTSILLALGAMFSGAWADLLYKRAQTSGINAASFLLLQSTIFSVIIWAAGLLSGQLQGQPVDAWVYGLPAGLIAYIGLWLFVESLQKGDASINVPIFRLSFVVTAIAAVFFLGESVKFAKVLGLIFAVISVLSLANLASSTLSFRSLLPLLLATLAFGIVGVLIKKATIGGSGTVALLMIQSIAFTAGSFLNALFSRQLKPNDTTKRYAPAVALLQLGWSFLLIQSLQTGDASVSYPIVQLSFVLTTILAVFLLKEAMSPRKGFGLALAIMAVVALSIP